MDEFFLRPEQRTHARLSEPGGNVDRERFLTEVLIPLKEGKDFAYSPFSCRTMSLAAPVAVKASPVTIVEGSYACHPDLREFYDLRIFLEVDPARQLRRLALRDGDGYLPMFIEKWIPLEEQYHKECAVREACVVLSE
jgi:uridine kinase